MKGERPLEMAGCAALTLLLLYLVASGPLLALALEHGGLGGSPGHPSPPWANAIMMLYSPLLYLVDVLDLERSEALRGYVDFFRDRF